MTTCEMRWDTPDNVCGLEAQHAILAGCVHEHVSKTTVCAECLLQVRMRMFVCARCKKAGHRCLMTVRVEK